MKGDVKIVIDEKSVNNAMWHMNNSIVCKDDNFRKLGYNEARETIYEVLHKEIPKKPKEEEDENGNKCIECPNGCGFIGYKTDCMNDESYQPNYCSICGQLLDWSDYLESEV